MFVDSVAHTQKDDVESNRGSLENVAEVFVLFLCGVQLVLRFNVLTILDLDEVDVTPSLVEVFRSVLSGVGGSTGGWPSEKSGLLFQPHCFNQAWLIAD